MNKFNTLEKMLLAEDIYPNYREVYYYIESGYRMGDGWGNCTQRHIADVKNEMANICERLGFSIKHSKYSGGCDEAFRGKERLYLHPMEISGEIKENSIVELAIAFSQAQSFRMYLTNIVGYVFDLTNEEIEHFMRNHKDEIKADIKKQYKEYKRRRKTFNSMVLFNDVYDKYMLHKTGGTSLKCSMNIEYVLLKEFYNELIADGEIGDK